MEHERRVNDRFLKKNANRARENAVAGTEKVACAPKIHPSPRAIDCVASEAAAKSRGIADSSRGNGSRARAIAR